MQTIPVGNRAEFARALETAKAGTKILLAPGDYGGGFYRENLRGEPGKPIVIAGADPKRPPRFTGGNTALQLSNVAYLELRDLLVEGSRFNGINIDDGGTFDTPAHHITLKNLTVHGVGEGGNNDGIKLSGLEQFTIENCTIEEWSRGGSGVDMVGCHRGTVLNSTFRNGGSSGIQMKGGTARITVRRCRFEEAGARALNIGGSTGLPYFRPPGAKYEAKDITVEECRFTGSEAPLAFVGVDGAVVRRCRIERPGKWVIRILQETREPGFVPCRNVLFEENTVLFRSDRWVEGGINIGSGVAAETFRFRRNRWYCEDNPARSKPRLPTPEEGGIYGQKISDG
ncbi:MAG: hypothetical protein OHK0029_22700 [Armatimonadaceae bacterium]